MCLFSSRRRRQQQPNAPTIAPIPRRKSTERKRQRRSNEDLQPIAHQKHRRDCPTNVNLKGSPFPCQGKCFKSPSVVRSETFLPLSLCGMGEPLIHRPPKGCSCLQNNWCWPTSEKKRLRDQSTWDGRCPPSSCLPLSHWIFPWCGRRA